MNVTIATTHPDYEWISESVLSMDEIIGLGVSAAKLIESGGDDNLEGRGNVEYLSILNEVSSLRAILNGSSMKGQISETIIHDNICRLFPHADVVHIGKTTGKGDIVVTINGYVIMVEVKNYSKNVPTSEQKKFERDLITNEYDAGIMLSIGTGIAGRSSSFEHEMVGNKFAVYLSNAGSDGMSLSWALLFIIASLDMTNKLHDDSKETKDMVIAYVKNKLDVIRDCIMDNDNIKKAMSNMSISLKRTIDNEVATCNEIIQTANCKLGGLVSNFTSLINSGEMVTDMSLLHSEKKAQHSLCDMSRSELNTLAKQKVIKKISTMKPLKLV